MAAPTQATAPRSARPALFAPGDRVYVARVGWGVVTVVCNHGPMPDGYYVRTAPDPGASATYYFADNVFADEEACRAAGRDREPNPRRPIDVAARERARLPW